MKILCICLSSGIQRTLSFENFCKGQVNRTSDFIENLSGKAVNTARVISQLKEQDAARFKKLTVSVLCPEGKDNKAQFKFLAQKESFKVKTVTIKGRTRQCWTLLEKDGTTTEVIADEKAEAKAESAFASEAAITEADMAAEDAAAYAAAEKAAADQTPFGSN